MRGNYAKIVLSTIFPGGKAYLKPLLKKMIENRSKHHVPWRVRLLPNRGCALFLMVFKAHPLDHRFHTWKNVLSRGCSCRAGDVRRSQYQVPKHISCSAGAKALHPKIAFRDRNVLGRLPSNLPLNRPPDKPNLLP